MIDLEKQKEPSEEEIQERVNEVYEYAVDLYTNPNMSQGKVRQELINQELYVEDATTVVSNLEQQEHEAKIDTSNYCYPLKVFDRYKIRAGFLAWNSAL